LKLKTEYIFKLFLLFLPFTQALTINIFFPLKISEVLLVLLIFILLQTRFRSDFINSLSRIKVLYFFMTLVTISFLVNIFWNYPYTLKSVDFRVGPEIDSFLRLGYIYLNILGLIIGLYYLSKNLQLLRYWLYGAIAASLYSWYLVFSSAIGIPYLKLFGMEEYPQTIMGMVRSGTFKEGNFFGLYLILSGSIAFYLKRTKIAWLLFLTVLTTFSTISIISAVVFILIYLKNVFLRLASLRIFIISIPFVIIASILFVNSQFYEKYVEQKLFTPMATLTPANLSKVDRYLTGKIAFEAGYDNPVFGVGPFNYGLHYDHYNNINDIVENQTDWSRNYFKRKNKRAITNNVYLEVWAEYGVLGFILFCSFLISTLWLSIKNRSLAITAGLLALYISLNAFPSFIILFLWVFLCIPYAHFYNKNGPIK
jgi:O-antigen ligase